MSRPATNQERLRLARASLADRNPHAIEPETFARSFGLSLAAACCELNAAKSALTRLTMRITLHRDPAKLAAGDIAQMAATYGRTAEDVQRRVQERVAMLAGVTCE